MYSGFQCLTALCIGLLLSAAAKAQPGTITTISKADPDSVDAYTDVGADLIGNAFVALGLPGFARVSPSGIVSRFNVGLVGTLAVARDSSIFLVSGNRILQLRPDGTNVFWTAAGPPGFSGDGGQSTLAAFNRPGLVTTDVDGNLYIFDSLNYRIRKVTPDGIVRTIAGNGQYGEPVDGADALQTPITFGVLKVDRVGNVYWSQTYVFDNPANPLSSARRRPRVWKLTKQGKIELFAGTGTDTFGGDGGQARQASLYGAYGLAADAAGGIYISEGQGDNLNGRPEGSRIRRVAPNGIITTVAGTATTGYSGDGGPATAAQLHRPLGIDIDPKGNLLIADNLNRALRRVDLTGLIGPVPLPSRISNAAGGPQQEVSPNAFISIYGENLAPTAATWDSSVSGDRLPTVLGGTSVQIAGKECYISYAGPTQINLLTPPDLPEGVWRVDVRNQFGVNAWTTTVRAASPGLFTYPVAGRTHPAALHSDYSLIGPNGLTGNSRPVRPGDVILLYATGLGSTNPQAVPGRTLPAPLPLANPASVRVLIGGIAAPVSFAGMVAAGLYQVNVTVPAGLPAGDPAIQIQVGSVSSATGVTLPVIASGAP